MADDLPIPQFDGLPTGAIESRVRTLDAEGVRRLLDHERSRADRPQIVAILEHRLAGLEAGDRPSGGDPAAAVPETSVGAPTDGQRATPTEGPPQNPPSQGNPTNPAQPRR